MRDDFKGSDVRLLAERAGYRCSNQNCRKPTIGPDARDSRASIGVAAHISAASPLGPRFDETLNSDERSSIHNGIWLCQTCSRLIDSDPSSYPPDMLGEWKRMAETRAFLALRGFDVVLTRDFRRLEGMMPELIREMREDLREDPFTRRFIVLPHRLVYNGGSREEFRYDPDNHENILGKLQVLKNYRAIVEICINEIPRYEFKEDFVDYLTQSQNI